MNYPFKSKPPTLSLCMIVRNEEKYLHDCLTSVRDVVDEIIVVDTGCSDGTLEVARQFSAHIFQFPWTEDFAAARNESIKHATCDWIFQIDADERLLPESKLELRRALKNSNTAIVSVLIDSPKAEQNKGHVSRAHRLFRNIPGVRFTGRIHEQVSPSVGKLGGREGFSTIKLHHLGYAKSPEEMAAKSERNHRLLKKQVDEEPANPYWHYTLAQNQVLRGEYTEALDSLKAALRIGGLPSDIRCSILNNLAEVHLRLENYSTAISFAEESLATINKQTTSYLLLNEIYGNLQEPRKQIHCLKSVVEIMAAKEQNYNQLALEAYVDPAAVYINLGMLYFAEREYEKACATFVKARNLDHANIRALKGLSDSLIALFKYEKALPLLRSILTATPNDPTTLEKIAWVSLKLQDLTRAAQMYSNLLVLDPDNPDIQKRLAGIYYKIGEVEKSKALLQRSSRPHGTAKS